MAPDPQGVNTDRGRIARHVAALMRLLHGRRSMPPFAHLARELGVCERTVYRYIDAIEQAGWPLPQRRQTESA